MHGENSLVLKRVQKTGQHRPCWLVLLLLASCPAAPHLSFISECVILRSIKVWTVAVFHTNRIPPPLPHTHTHTPFDWRLSSNCRVCFSVAPVEKVTTAEENVSVKARLIWPCCLEGVNRGTKAWLTLLAPVILTNACKSTLRLGFRAGAACSSHPASLSSHTLITKRFKDALDKCHFTTEPCMDIF